jgi:hypothetical protein
MVPRDLDLVVISAKVDDAVPRVVHGAGMAGGGIRTNTAVRPRLPQDGPVGENAPSSWTRGADSEGEPSDEWTYI